MCLLLYGDSLWRAYLRRTLPILDHLQQARVSVAHAYLWAEEWLHGDETIAIDEVRAQWAFYRDRRPDMYGPLVES